MAKLGRGKQIELYVIVPADMSTEPLAEWDRIRDEISKAVGTTHRIAG
ncbi:Cobalt-zinc-cadmium resistance protein [Labilithrix luteola]|uniref:Cobalt-zinc-cadmium resistance protein n=1 Tax=Labilithrix luteola TaxID=1391654 RepID=A0A0K1PQL5_9BACT|nr:Cobalt-zinc-cadmium resistance protein [Labilithrix luteola]